MGMMQISLLRFKAMRQNEAARGGGNVKLTSGMGGWAGRRTVQRLRQSQLTVPQRFSFVLGATHLAWATTAEVEVLWSAIFRLFWMEASLLFSSIECYSTGNTVITLSASEVEMPAPCS